MIHRRRLRASLSQEELAGRAGLERSYLSLLENGKRMPGVEILFRIADASGIRASTLFNEIEREWAKAVCPQVSKVSGIERRKVGEQIHQEKVDRQNPPQATP